MGHPAPFNLKQIGIGGAMPSLERLEMFVKQDSKQISKYQDMRFAGPSASGKEFDYGWEQMRDD